MRSRLGFCYALICLLLAEPTAFAQNVVFSIVPLGGTTVNPSGTSSVVVQPGAVLSYQVYATVVSDPNFPTTAGLAGFDLNVLTSLGIAQTTPFNFSPAVSTLFSVNQGSGLTTSDDLINISGAQNTGSTGTITTGFAVGTRTLIGTGQVVTPNVEGDFNVNLTGNATLFNLVNSINTIAATVAASEGFTVSTRFTGSSTPVSGQTDNTNTGTNTGTSGTGNGGTVIEAPAGSSSATGTGGSVPNEEQVGASISEPPNVSSLNPGVCGLGVVTSVAASLLGLALMKQARN